MAHIPHLARSDDVHEKYYMDYKTGDKEQERIRTSVNFKKSECSYSVQFIHQVAMKKYIIFC